MSGVCECGTVAKMLRDGSKRYGHLCPHGVPCDLGKDPSATENKACRKCIAIREAAA